MAHGVKKTDMADKYYAHSQEGKPTEDWHRLEDHLKAVAEMAGKFAAEFGAGEWGYLAGLWHDLGKCLPSFHKMLCLNNKENCKECLKIGEAIHV
jgi:HD superfamily phosphohydrolase YqeK